jgi:hypothetical protein
LAIEETYDLKLRGGKVVRDNWGTDPVNAAQRYADTHPGSEVIATRPSATYEIVIGSARIDPRS